MKRAIVTGASGFYGHHLVKYLLKNTDWNIIAMCRENFVGNLQRLYELEEFQKWKSRVKIIWHDLRSPINTTLENQIKENKDINYIYHIAASSHVDRSIEDPLSFVYDNVVGTTNLLNFALNTKGLEKFLLFSTDEVYGPSLGNGYKYTEEDRYNAGNPYSASKAAAEDISIAYENTYKLPIMITHCMNILGERQHSEKFMPLIIKKAINQEEVHIHMDSRGKIPGKRKYIYADEVSNAVMFITNNGKSGEKYNIEGQAELNNEEFVDYIGKKLDLQIKKRRIPGVEDRPGHDFDYAISGEKLIRMGYKQKYDFWSNLDKTILWYKDNPQWLY
jgi:dTDP-glucose 4,6-dehydratase